MTNPANKEEEVKATKDNLVLRRNRTQMMLIMLVGFATLGASYAVFYFAKNSADWATTNNGAFVEPSINTAQLGWEVDGSLDQWWLWAVAKDCDSVCQSTVGRLRALHILLNRDAKRVRRGYTGATGVMEPQWLAQYPDLARITVADPGSLEDGVYIVDPHGNLVFFYPLDTNPEPVLQDLKKLLKISQIG